MTEELDKCPVCGKGHFKEYLRTKDHSITQEEFTIQKCQNCNFVFTNPRPDEKSIGKYYQSEEYISHSDKSTSVIGILYKAVRNYTLRQKVKLIEKYHSKGELLDYGCGTGYFLSYAKSKKWNVAGIEPDNNARSLAIKNTGTEIQSNSEKLPENKFDIITLWHVLEHIHGLNKTFAQLKNSLQPNGYIIIAVPNLKSHDAEYYKDYWAAYDVPRHLYHFSPETLNIFALKHGMKIVDTKPMLFDSFYVCMLSEKYKGNSINLLKPFIKGCKSNIYAKKTKNYSSLIYILKNENHI